MLLKQLLESPRTSSSLVVYDPFRALDRQELVREVIGLANADVDGPRFILFGVNPTAVESDGIVGIPESAAAELKKAHRLVSRLVEPTLDLAFIYDKINGKLVGTLEIDGCEFGPYFVGQDFGDALSRGQSWIREERNLRAMERAGLVPNGAPASAAETALSPEHVDVVVGFNDQPDCHYLELPIPDTSNPPFADAHDNESKRATITQVIKDAVGSVTTQIQRLGHGGGTKSSAGAVDSSATDITEEAGKIFADARNHYFFEEKAVKLVLCIRNQGDAALNGVTIEFGFPRISDFDVADRIYVSPFDKRSSQEIRNMGYPVVERRDDAIFVRSEIETLAAGSTQQALRCPLRMAVGPGMERRKVGIRYTLRAPGGRSLSKGELKIRFGRVAESS